MMGTQAAPEQFFYDFCLEDHVPDDHLLRRIDRFLDLSEVRATLRPYYSHLGRPSIDPELMIRMLMIGYSLGIRSERRLCEEVHLNLAYRWFCGLGLKGKVPDYSTFSVNRNGRFRDSDLLRVVFEATVRRSMKEGLVGGEGFAVDASLIQADANKQRSIPGDEWDIENIPADAIRAVIERVEDRFGLKPDRLAADTAYGSAPMLAWLVKDKKIAPHIPVIDKSRRKDGTLSRADFAWDGERGIYICPQGKHLKTTGRIHEGRTNIYFARTGDCRDCPLKRSCCPKAPQRKIPRDIDEDARDVARALAGTEAAERSRHERKKVEMLFAHLKRILKLGRLRLRGPYGAQDEFLLAATAQNLRKLAKLVWKPPEQGIAVPA